MATGNPLYNTDEVPILMAKSSINGRFSSHAAMTDAAIAVFIQLLWHLKRVILTRIL